MKVNKWKFYLDRAVINDMTLATTQNTAGKHHKKKKLVHKYVHPECMSLKYEG